MNGRRFYLALFFAISVFLVTGSLVVPTRGEDKKARSESEKAAAKAKAKIHLPATEAEARSRARWMHELLHGTLQVMHRDFFDKDDSLDLPSQSLEDVFREMSWSWGVDIEWLGVNATKDKDHEPDDEFEKAAAKALEKGDPEFEGMHRGRYRYVGAIRIQNECLSCHVPNRRDLEDRVAGLSISMRLQGGKTATGKAE